MMMMTMSFYFDGEVGYKSLIPPINPIFSFNL